MPDEIDQPPPNRGAELLRQIEQGHAKIALEVGCAGAPVVFDWRAGRRAPSDYFRIKLHKAYGIPIDAWDHTPTGELIRRRNGRGWRRPSGTGSTPREPTERPEPAEPTELDPDLLTAPAARLEDTEAEALPPLGDTQAEVDAQLRRARAAAMATGIAPGQAARLSSEIRGLLRLRAQLESNEPVTLDRLARSDAFRKLRDEIVGVVRDCPHCLDKLIAVLAGEPNAPAPEPPPAPERAP